MNEAMLKLSLTNSERPRFVRFDDTAIIFAIIRVKSNQGFHPYWLRRHTEEDCSTILSLLDEKPDDVYPRFIPLGDSVALSALPTLAP